jgi:hypothetical protein
MIPCGGTEVPVPEREEAFLYLVQHFVRHLIAFGPETAADPVAAMLEPARRGRLIWLADLVLLARRDPGLDWDRIDRLGRDWGLSIESAGLRRYLASIGVAPDVVAPSDAAGGEATLRLIRRLTGIFPRMARASAGLQLRPILIARLWRFAFPGGEWIRWRYRLGAEAGALRVAVRMLGHAAGVALAAARMAVALPLAWIRSQIFLGTAGSALRNSDRNAPGSSSNCPR